jgi:hypothetical protein
MMSSKAVETGNVSAIATEKALKSPVGVTGNVSAIAIPHQTEAETVMSMRMLTVMAMLIVRHAQTKISC